MMINEFIKTLFTQDPVRFGSDEGDIATVNAVLMAKGYSPVTKEAFKLIANSIRRRNAYLSENPTLDSRKRKAPLEYEQKSIFDYMDEEDVICTKRITHYFKGDHERLSQSNSRIKSSVRGVDNEQIITSKKLFKLFSKNPELKKKRIITDSTNPVNKCIETEISDKSQTA